MRKKRKGGNTARNAIIALVVIAFFIIIFAISYQQPQKLQNAADYFEISNVEYIGQLTERGQLLEISELKFDIKAKLGDAHEVSVAAGLSNKEEGQVGTGTILKGQTEVAYIMFPNTKFQVPREEEGFIVGIDVASMEAYGTIFVSIVP